MALQLAGQRVALAVGIIVLAIGTVVAISLVKQRGESVRHDEITKVADERLRQLEDESSAEKKKEEPAASGNATQDTGSAAQPSKPQETRAEVLPQTGPELAAVVAAGSIAFSLAGYLQSRRLLR